MYFGLLLELLWLYDGGFGPLLGHFSTSKMMLMCISGGLEGLESENVEQLLVFTTFFEV